MRGKAGVKRHERPFGESAALYRKTGVGSNRPNIDNMNTLGETIRGYRFGLCADEKERCLPPDVIPAQAGIFLFQRTAGAA
ncbi:hypothetical protein [Sphingomonas sp. S6]|jgi:hypothetical protein|uniref:hypothetical protein n=1 Tax=Sphingomonas sp. S6 TaxID=3368600 RepID=UPI0028E8BC65|nr:hypothetical protein [uncultured Sphingomonas sp.]